MLPLHEADKIQFKSHIISNIESKEEDNELLNVLENFVGPKIYLSYQMI